MAQKHIVQSGDTIGALAKRFNVPKSSISGFRSNDPNVIFPGEELTITEPTPQPIEQPTGGLPQAPVQPVQQAGTIVDGKALQPTGGLPQAPVQPVQPVTGQVPPAPVDPQVQPVAAPAAPVAPALAELAKPAEPAFEEPARTVNVGGEEVNLDEQGNIIDEQGNLDVQGDTVFNQFGISGEQVESGFLTNPAGTIADLVRQVMEATGLPDARENLTRISGEIEDLENERDREIENIKDDPFSSVGSKRTLIANVGDKFDRRINARVNRLTLLQSAQQDARQQAQFAATTAIRLFGEERDFQQGQIEAELDRQERVLEAERKIEEVEFERGVTLDKIRLEERRVALAERKNGLPSDVETRKSIEIQEKEVATRATQINTISTINSILGSEDLATVSGISRLGFSARTASTAGVRSELSQLKSLTSLSEREKLKGTGAISDFEAAMLSNSANALNFAIEEDGRVSMPDEEVEKNLRNIRGIMRLKAGQSVTTIITDPATGESRAFEDQTRQDVDSAALQGFIIDFE